MRVPESRAWLASCVCVCGPASAWHCHCGGLPNLTDGTSPQARRPKANEIREANRDARARRQMRIRDRGTRVLRVSLYVHAWAVVGKCTLNHRKRAHILSFDTLIVSVACAVTQLKEVVARDSKSCATLSSFWAQTVPSWFLARVGLCVRRSACVADPSEYDSDTEPDTPSSRLPSSARSWSLCRNSIRWEHRTVASRTRQLLLHGFVQVVRTALLSQVSRSQHSGK